MNDRPRYLPATVTAPTTGQPDRRGTLVLCDSRWNRGAKERLRQQWGPDWQVMITDLLFVEMLPDDPDPQSDPDYWKTRLTLHSS